MVSDVLLWVLIGMYLAASLLLHVYGINCYVMIVLLLKSRRRQRQHDEAVRKHFRELPKEYELPYVTTQLPIYNERNVTERLLRAVCAFDWPRERHEIQVLDDSTDETVEIAERLVDELRRSGHDVVYRHRKNRKGYKAGALEEGLADAKGEYVAIFDADFVPPPDFLRQTIPFLMNDPRCGFVQTRWGHRNRGFSFLTRIQSLGIDGHFVVEQAARCWSNLFFNFNGTAGVWRRRAIVDAGGWKADTLTEDLDLSYRTLLAGWRARYLQDVVTPAEVPTNINALKTQQYRWAKGSIQAARKLLPTVWRRRDLSVFKRIEATLHLTHYMVHPLILFITLLIPPLIFLAQDTFVSVYIAPLVGVMLLALFGPSILYVFSQAISKGKIGTTLLLLPALMAFGIGLAVNNTRAVISALLGHKSEFVRTPKLGQVAEVGYRTQDAIQTLRSYKLYRQPLSRLYWAELFMGLWALLALTGTVYTFGTIASPFLLVHAVGFLCVGILSIKHERRARKQGC